MDYQVIALDLDGTLLTPEKTILPASLTALQNARKSGAKVVIVTGRHFVAIHPFYQALALNTPAICCNGALLYYKGFPGMSTPVFTVSVCTIVKK